jgi:hypothetical protein
MPLEGSRDRNKIFIVDHYCCEVYLDEVLEECGCILDSDSTLLDNIENDIERSRYFVGLINAMLDEKTNYVVLKDQRMLVSLGGLAREAREDYGFRWEFVAFFHNDEDTKKVFRLRDDRAQALEKKAKQAADLAACPFVKQVEVPYAMLLDYPFLDGIFGMDF